jgi:D-3-phosphoglycerate dehydrogenase / 2-oxoglutarate reductase
MKYRVVFTDPDQHIFEPEIISKLTQINAEFEVAEHKAESELTRICRTADAIVTSAAKISEGLIEQLENCRIIARVGTGFDNVDWNAAAKRGIPVTNVPGFATEDVATHTMALLLALHRRITTLNDEVRRGIWTQNHVLPASRLSAMVLGIIGYGAIGQAMGVRAAGFGMKIKYFDVARRIEPAPTLGMSCRSLEELLAVSDVVSAHVPLTSATAGMLNRAAFQLMKPTALLINTARGAVVDETALHEALKSGVIAGAALDVLQDEPPCPDNPLLALGNVIVTPHCASHSDDSLVELRRRAIEEVVRALRGEPLKHVVNGISTRRKVVASHVSN